MARKKVKLEYIANDASRRNTFKKRRKGFMKKVRELSTLCDVPACAIVYGNGESKPETYPAEPAEVRDVLHKFWNVQEPERTKKMVNQIGILRERIKKLETQLQKQQKDYCKVKSKLMLLRILSGGGNIDDDLQNINDVRSLSAIVNEHISLVQNRIDFINGRNTAPFTGSGNAEKSPMFIVAAGQEAALPLQFDVPVPLEEHHMQWLLEFMSHEELNNIMNYNNGDGNGGGGGGGGEYTKAVETMEPSSSPCDEKFNQYLPENFSQLLEGPIASPKHDHRGYMENIGLDSTLEGPNI